MDGEIDTTYYKILRLPDDKSFKNVFETVSKKIPKKVTYAGVYLYINEDYGDIKRIFERDSKKITKDRRQFYLERYGECQVYRISSNISDGEYYYQIFIKDDRAFEGEEE